MEDKRREAAAVGWEAEPWGWTDWWAGGAAARGRRRVGRGAEPVRWVPTAAAGLAAAATAAAAAAAVTAAPAAASAAAVTAEAALAVTAEAALAVTAEAAPAVTAEAAPAVTAETETQAQAKARVQRWLRGLAASLAARRTGTAG